MVDIFTEPIYRDLEKLNFTVNESKVYLTLIRIGSSYAGRIAKEARLDRSSTYNALKALIERGIVGTIFEKKRTIYVPADPKKIMDYFKEKEEIASSIIPKLRDQFKASKESKNISLFRGLKGIKTVLQDILDTVNSGNEYYVFGSEGLFHQKMPYYAPIFLKRKESKHVRTKIIVREGRQTTSKSKLTEYRKVPSDTISPATINVYDGKVAIVVWDELPQAILIENEGISETLKNYFQFMWKHAKKV